MYSSIVEDLRVRPKMLSPEEHITSPNDVDVINGRGQGVQRHAGNEKYRALVLYNKVCFSLVWSLVVAIFLQPPLTYIYLEQSLYAKCHKSDKAKISKVRQITKQIGSIPKISFSYSYVLHSLFHSLTPQAIVAAVRQVGGRFLELDEMSQIYHDIGDKKAYAKTSQALREGQKQIRQKIYSDAGQSKSASSLLESIKQRPIPLEEYFRYSIQVLESLHKRSTETFPSSSLHIQMEVAPFTPTREVPPMPDLRNTNGKEIDALFPTSNNVFGNLLSSYPLVHMEDYTRPINDVDKKASGCTPTNIGKTKQIRLSDESNLNLLAKTIMKL